MTELFAPVVSITTTQRRRFFWAAWWTAPPERAPFRKPDASGGGEATHEAALAAAEKAAGTTLRVVEPEWSRAWMRVIRGGEPWPGARSLPGASASRAKGEGGGSATAEPGSIWALLGVTTDVDADTLRAAFRKRALETHPDHGGDPTAFRRVVAAYREAQRRLRKPRRRDPR